MWRNRREFSLFQKTDDFIADYHKRPFFLLAFQAAGMTIIAAVILNYLTFFGLLSHNHNKLGYYLQLIAVLFSPLHLIIALDIIDNASWHFYEHTMSEWFD